jgi:phosphoadenosine phosphosulfate reductase
MKFIDKVENAKTIITDTLDKYNRIAVACSFGKDSMVVLHLALQLDPDIPVFSVMTPFKFKETFEYKDKITREWNLNIKTYMRHDLIQDYFKDPDACCQYYKVDMTREAVRDLDAWICGLRRTEGRTRANYDFIEEKGGLIKINPILDFTELDVWRYLAVNNIPAHPKYAEGYRSLGCEPCSHKEKDEAEMEREGRWLGTSKCGGECGIHTQPLKMREIA